MITKQNSYISNYIMSLGYEIEYEVFSDGVCAIYFIKQDTCHLEYTGHGFDYMEALLDAYSQFCGEIFNLNKTFSH